MHSYDLLNHLNLYNKDIPVFISIYSLDEPDIYSIFKITDNDTCMLMYILKGTDTITVEQLIKKLYKHNNKEIYATGKVTWLDIEKIEMKNNQLILYYDEFIQNSMF
jgi:hypothetical protein